MDEPLDEQYLSWLYTRIGSVQETRQSKTYWRIFRLLYSKEFVWLIPNDDNRVEDGRDLRYEFLDETGLSGKIDPNWMGMGCSVLELIFGVAKRLSFEADRTPLHWFWEVMNNLGLSGYTDRDYDQEQIEDVVDIFIWRTYRPDGQGGMFPLRYPPEDQREVELWYQMAAYILERN